MSAPTIKFRPDLQGLRAVAIILVVLAHAGMPGLAGGFVGVDVFFVLSGYLISGLLVREYLENGRIQWLGFVARRLKRLLPALLVMLSLVMTLGVVLLSNHEFTEQTASVAYAATWTSNLFFAFTTFDYFAELHLRDLFLHTWSLGVEEQFYLLWPMFAIFLTALARRVRGGNGAWGLLLAAIGVLFVGSLALSFYWSYEASTWAFYLMPARIWQFSLGAGVYVWFEFRDRQSIGTFGGPLRRPLATGFMGIVLVVGSAIFFSPDMVYPGGWALLPSIGAAMVIAAGRQEKAAGIAGMLSHPGMVWIGDRSYSWYLWHWPLLMLGFAWGLKGNPTATAALVLLALAFATLSYRWIELPLWKGRLSIQPPVRSVAFSVLAIGVITSTLSQANLMFEDKVDRGAELAGTARFDMPEIYRSDCDTWYLDATVQPCIFGEPDARKTAVLFGDSIGAQWYSVLPEVLPAPEWRFVVLTKSSCAIVDEDYHYAAAGGVYEVCSSWRNQALDYLEALRPDVVIVGSASTYAFSEQQWSDGKRRIFDRLSSIASHVFVIPGTPYLSFDGPGCLARWMDRHEAGVSSGGSVCRERSISTVSSTVVGYIEGAAAAFDNVRVLNLNDLVCPGGYCAARNAQGLVVFRDRQHLTDSFVRAQAPVIGKRLQSLGLGFVSVD